MPRCQFRDATLLGACPRVVEHRGLHQLVIEHEIGGTQTFDGAHGQQPGMSRTGTDQGDEAKVHGFNCSGEAPVV